MNRVYIVGAGGIGLFIQYYLQNSLQTLLIARDRSCATLAYSPLRVTGIVQGELRISCISWNQLERAEEPATVFVAVKATEVAEVLSILNNILTPPSNILLCQNGIGIYEIGRHLCPKHHIYRLLCWIGVRRVDLDWIHVAGLHKFDLAAETSLEQPLRFWAEVLERAGIPTTFNTDPVKSEWEKALWNITVNGLCSIINAHNGAILDHPELREIAENIVEETVEVARNEGIMLDASSKAAVFQSLAKTKENINATLQDLRAGRHPELEFFNGAVVTAATKHHMRAPLNLMILRLVEYLDRQKLLKEH